ncbi:MAG: HlyC/CorC family transporter [Clostridia bacterium]|nr:HlyC/CorC family transporter [Clostridia bacterium]
MDSSPGFSISIISIIILICLSAFFSASETALTASNRLKIKTKAEDGDKRAKTALKLISDFDKTISTILIGNNIVNIAATSISTVLAISIWEQHGSLIATIVMTVLVLAFGEILPKSFAKTNAEGLLLSVAKTLRFLSKVLTPLSFIFSGIKFVVSRGDDEDEKKPSFTEDELKVIMDEVQDEGVLEDIERELAQNALDFDDIEVGEILTPRVNLVAVDIEKGMEKIKEAILEEKYTRIPVYRDSIDTIIGILNAKDFLSALVNSGENINVEGMLQEAMYLPDTMKISAALSQMQKEKVQLAIVTDQYGGTAGIVTMEDILEELVGEIWDEHDEVLQLIETLSPLSFRVNGNMDTGDMLEAIGFNGEEIESRYNTVGGWATEVLGKIPEPGEWFDYENLRIEIEEVEDNRVAFARVEYTSTKDEDEEDED